MGDKVVKDGGKAIRHAGGLEMERSGTVSLGPKVRSQHVQVTWPEDISEGRSQRKPTERSQVEDGETQKGNGKEEISNRAEEMSERRE